LKPFSASRRRRSRRVAAALFAATFGIAAASCTGPQPEPGGERTATTASVPRRDLSGAWAGPPLPTLQDPPPLTAWGQARYDGRKPTWGPKAVGIGESNDPLVTCDPLGFPRAMLYETRGFEFLHTATKTVQLLQYQRVWREIWTDGRSLPSDVGGDKPESPDTRWYGYSVGRWVDDYTFVVETTGSDERAWLDYRGYPHSTGARFEERYHRTAGDTLEVTVTVTDSVAYSRPFQVMQQTFVRNAKQELEEQLCVPSDAIEYFNTIAAPTAPVR
jgi:hypothetical protein